MDPLILASAHKHGIADDDVLHVIHHATRIYEQADGILMKTRPKYLR